VVSFNDRPPEEKASVYRQCGNVAFGRGDIVDAEQYYHKALEWLPDEPHLLSNLAACALASTPAQPARALGLLDRLLTNHPNHIKGRLRAGRCCVMLARLEAALEHFEAAEAAAKSDASESAEAVFAQNGTEISVEAAGNVPAIDDSVGGAAGSDSWHERALEQAKEGLVSVRRLFTQIERCTALANAGRCNMALELANEVKQKCVDATLGSVLVVRSLEGGGRLAEARAEAEACLSLHATDGPMRLTFARVLARSGQVSEADQMLTLLLQIQPNYAAAEVALSGLREAMKMKGEGNAAYSRGEYDAAEGAYSAAMSADTADMLNPILLGNRAQAKLQSGRAVGALVDCNQALEYDASNVKLLLRRAACRVALESTEQARRDYELVLKLQPDNPTATQRLCELPVPKMEGESSEEAEQVLEMDPYKELGVCNDASYTEIRKAFREKALKLHPDKYSGEERDEAEEKFQRVKKAAAILTDKWKRWQLDEGFASMDDLVTQFKADAEFAYYATTAPQGYTRDVEDDRRYNPFKKPSKEFDMNPLRHNPEIQRQNQLQFMQQNRLGGGPPIQLMDKSSQSKPKIKA